MARFTLRKKHKIKAHFDQKTLDRILLSLKSEFETIKKIDVKKLDGEPYDIIAINDSGHTCGLIIFYVVRQTFDVYNLAFKEFVN